MAIVLGSACSTPVEQLRPFSPPPKGLRPAGPARGYRADIEGLRAVAVLMVVLYHVGVGGLAGGFTGVDIFFVISGFLITGLLLQELEATGSINLARFWARRARRLLPALSVVVGATAIAVWVWWPVLRRALALSDLSWGALYAANWRFAQRDIDYLTAGQASPALHLWSLAVEEQFYLLCPLVLLGAALATRRRWRARRPAVLAAAVVACWVLSFAWNLHWSVTHPQWAYYSLPTRLWQLATGGLVACGAGWLARRGWRTRVTGLWLGLVALVVGAVMAGRPGVAYPGWVALVPTGAAAAILAVGVSPWPQHQRRRRNQPDGVRVVLSGPMRVLISPVRMLASGPMQRLGTLSYGWYLWHWPMLLLAPAVVGHRLSVLQGVAAAGVALLVAALSYRWVENPIRRAPALVAHPRYSLAVGAALTLLCLVVVQVGLRVGSASALTRDFTQLNEAGSPEQVRVRYSPLHTRYDAALMGSCHVDQPVTQPPPGCEFGGTGAAGRVMVAGDSHAGQWFPAVNAAAQQRGLAVRAWTKSWCQLADVHWQLYGRPYTECDQWREAVLREATSGRYAVLVTSSTTFVGASAQRMPMQIVGPDNQPLSAQAAQQAWLQGYARTLTRLRQAGVQVVVIRDTPLMLHPVPECLAQFRDQAQRCATSRWRADPGIADVRVAQQLGAVTGDFTDLLCSPVRCPALVQGYIAWWDKAHLAAAFVQSLSSPVGVLIDQALAAASAPGGESRPAS